MKRYFILLILVITSGICLLKGITPNKGEQLQQVQVVQAADTYHGALYSHIHFGKMPLYFTANKGQVNGKALFYTKASRYTLWLTKKGLIFDSIKKVGKGKVKFARDVSQLTFLGADKNPEIIPLNETTFKVNYFKGNDRSKWHFDIPTSQAVLYKRLYKNIDLKVYGIEKEIEYDWMVKPGGNPGDIRFQYKNIKGSRIGEGGNLLIETDFGELIHKKPASYQMSTGSSGEREYVVAAFKKIAEDTYGFEVGEYDKSRELIIDPVVLAYSTYLGGEDSDVGYRIASDGSGCVYITGSTDSSDFPILNQYQDELMDDYDIILTKVDTTKSGVSSLVYSTYLGGDADDIGSGIAVDGSGCAYLTGSTESSDFPTKNEYQEEPGNDYSYDAFIVKVDTTKSGASSLIYSTYLGGEDKDRGHGIAVDGSGAAYVTGFTESLNFPIKNQFQAYPGVYSYANVFLTKVDTTKSGASSLIYSTYLGGSSQDEGFGIAVDGSGCAYLTGSTWSSDFPMLNEFQTYKGWKDVFVTKLDTTKSGTSGLIYSTCLGDGFNEEGFGIAIDGGSFAYVTGYTSSGNFPLKNQFQEYQGMYSYINAFLTKLDTAESGASSLIYSTYLAGSVDDWGAAIAVDGSGCAYVTGSTESSDFPTRNEYQADREGWDAFITKLDTTKSGASSLIYSTYLGGDADDSGAGIAVDGSGSVFVSGVTESSDFPTLNQYQGTYQGGDGDAFITRLALCTGTPSLELNRDSLNFSAVSGGSQTGSQTVSMVIGGGCSTQWTTSCREPWIKITPSTGTGPALVTVSVDTAGLTAGSYSGTVFITYMSISNSVSVNLTILDAVSTNVPFGDFSTPPDASIARGSIPVTGWVLDDIEVESVKIYRDGSIYVGDAVFVDGARPDVEAAFPDYPFNYRAGWGYMLLTNFFPNSGNGIFTLSAKAFDKEGNQVTLGNKTITCDNANAVKPFGAIDTPVQGGTASGSGYINWGWALTPQPNTIPTDGSTIHVYVDGVNLGNPNYNHYRADIASLFSGYANSNGAVGYFILDTTTYTNGTHTIYWTAEDEAGNRDGIGSRYFNIQNSGSDAQSFHIQYLMSNVQRLSMEVEPDYFTPVTVKKGCGWNTEAQEIYPDDNGIITVETRELERVVIHLDGDNPSTVDSYLFLSVNGQLRPLPIGSTFDAKRDIFYWQPGPGFIGQYDFVFVKRGLAGEGQKKMIRVIISCLRRPTFYKKLDKNF